MQQHISSPVHVGAVFRQFVSTTSSAKVKRFIVVSINPLINSLGYIFINSEPSPFPSVADWQIAIKKTDGCQYLDHDSYIDCFNIIEANLEWLKADIRRTPEIYLGDVKLSLLDKILSLIPTSPVIQPKLLKRYGFIK